MYAKLSHRKFMRIMLHQSSNSILDYMQQAKIAANKLGLMDDEVLTFVVLSVHDLNN